MAKIWMVAVALALAAPLAAQSPAPAERVPAAEEAVEALDVDRLLSDPDYAGAIADHLRVLEATPGQSEARRLWLSRALVYALASAGRHDRAEAAADALLRTQAADPASYDIALFAAQRADRCPRAAEIVGRALTRLPAEARSTLLSPERVGRLMRGIGTAGDKASRARIAEALLAAGGPGEGEPPSAPDWLREIMIARALDRGDTAAAGGRAGEVQGLSTMLRLATDRRYDPIHVGTDRLAAVRAAIQREDGFTAARLAAAPEDTERLVDRAGFLRRIGRDREVLDLLLPLMSDVRIVATRHRRALWLVNEAAYALIASGAAGEAVELMRPLFTMDMDANPELVNTSINFVGILWQAGQFGEALQRAEAFMARDARHASDYGRMWIIANAVCAATDLRRTAEAESWLRRTEGIADSNRSAMLQALLCRGNLDGAERVLLSALEDETNRSSAILWLQDYEPMDHADAAERLREAFRTLRSRPAVDEAFARHGHRLRLPMPAVHYGWY